MFKKVLDTPLIMFSTKVLSDFFPSIYAFFPQFSNFLTHFSPNVPFLYHLKMSENLRKPRDASFSEYFAQVLNKSSPAIISKENDNFSMIVFLIYNPSNNSFTFEIS